MEINKNNYEAIIIDYLEGNLNSQDKMLLLAFLEENPSIKEDFELLSSTSLELNPEQMVFNADSLKKPTQINTAAYSNKLIALLEGDLTDTEKEKLLHEIEVYPELKKEYHLFLQTKLNPNEEIHLSSKDKLKKKTGIIIPMFVRIASIAALFIAILFLFITYNQPASDNVLADRDNELVKSNKKEDSIKNILNRKSDVQQQILHEQDKQMIAFGGVNPAAAQRNAKKAIVPTNGAKPSNNAKKPSKENPLNNNNNNQSVNPVRPAKIIADNTIADNNQKPVISPVQTEINILEPVKENNISSALASESKTESATKQPLDISTYIREQLRYTAQSEVIAVNKPENTKEHISFIESIGLNILSVYNKIAKRDVKVKKTYNEEGEVEKVRLIASGW